jgi:hypothetical protein
MAGEQTCEEGSTIAPLAIGPYNIVWKQILGKYKTLEFFVYFKVTTWWLHEREKHI